MFTRSIDDVEKVEWGGGTSQRVLTAKDDMGFAVAHTVVRAGTESALQYRNHLEACYCIGGSGYVETADRSTRYEITPGVIYVLDEHDAHYLGAEDEDLILVSVFNPAINGDEKHTLTEGGFSAY
ncbi:ectoine synthase [Brachybacterium huguangmaarense]